MNRRLKGSVGWIVGLFLAATAWGRTGDGVVTHGAFGMAMASDPGSWLWLCAARLDSSLCGDPIDGGGDPGDIEPCIAHVGNAVTELDIDPGPIGDLGNAAILFDVPTGGVIENGVGRLDVMLRRLCLQGTAPIPLSCGDWALSSMKLDPNGEQPSSELTVYLDADGYGGTFLGDLAMNLELVFTAADGSSRTLFRSLVYSGFAPWAIEPGAGGVGQHGRVPIDGDCDGVAEDWLEGNKSFYAGWTFENGAFERSTACLATATGSGHLCVQGLTKTED